MLSLPSSISLSTRSLNHLADLIRAGRKDLRSPWRRLSAGRQALLALAHLRNGDNPDPAGGRVRRRRHDRVALHPRGRRPVPQRRDDDRSHQAPTSRRLTLPRLPAEAGRTKVGYHEAACPQACQGRVADAAAPSLPSRLAPCQPAARPHPSRRDSTSTHKRTGRRMESGTKLAPTAEPGPISPASLPTVSSSSPASHRAVPSKNLETLQGATRPDRPIRCHARSQSPGSTHGRIAATGRAADGRRINSANCRRGWPASPPGAVTTVAECVNDG